MASPRAKRTPATRGAAEQAPDVAGHATPMDVTVPAIPQAARRSSRIAGSLIGREAEVAALEERLTAAQETMSGAAVEGEPGIGKTTFLMAAQADARERGFATVSVSADEEIHGPFLLARGIFSSAALREGVDDTVRARLDSVCDLMRGAQDPETANLAPEMRVLRVYDQAALALASAARGRPVAMFLDDVQWADDDSLRVLRYLARTERTIPLFLMFAMRADEGAVVTELTSLLADLERMGVLRRISLSRFRQPETTELLRRRLGGDVELASAAAIHRQAEGVPFIVEELARTYRETGLLQLVDGSWHLARKAVALMPSAVRTLIQRRAARLPDDAKQTLADAAVIGRTFRISDVCAVRSVLGNSCTPSSVAESLAPAIAAGLLSEAPPDSGADYRFTHEQVREFAVGLLPAPRRREVNAAIVNMLTLEEPTAATLPILAKHALAAGDAERATRYSIEAAQSALKAGAGEEAMRLIEDALGTASGVRDRVALLRARDDALQLLRRPEDRLEGIAELTALAEASGDVTLELDVTLRKAAALRLDEQYDAAAALARDSRRRAAERADQALELAACLELGQDLLRATMGEGYTVTPLEADLDGAEDAYGQAMVLAEALHDQRSLAFALRESGIVSLSRIRSWFVDQFKAGNHLEIIRSVSAGVSLADVLPTLPIAGQAAQTETLLRRALDLFTEQGDRRGQMSCVIALAYLAWAPGIHVGSNPAQHIEEIRRLATRMDSISRESFAASADAQMLFAVHIFARAKVIPDLALTRGREAWEAAHAAGDRDLEFLAAGGTACLHRDLGDLAAMDEWLSKAAATATASPTPFRAWQLDVWRGQAAAARGDATRMQACFDQAVRQGTERARTAVRTETLSALALEAAQLGVATGDDALLATAEAAADAALDAAGSLPGQPPWRSQALAARATIQLARGDRQAAADSAREAIGTLRAAVREDPHLETMVPAMRVMFATGESNEIGAIRDEARILMRLVVSRIQDPGIRQRWLQGPVGVAVTELLGPIEVPSPEQPQADARMDEDTRQLMAAIGSPSLAGATAAALRQVVP